MIEEMFIIKNLITDKYITLEGETDNVKHAYDFCSYDDAKLYIRRFCGNYHTILNVSIKLE